MRVFPATSLAIEFCKIASFSGSVYAVASSRITIGASLSIALAIEIRCLSPPERCPPAPPTIVSNPFSSCMIKS